MRNIISYLFYLMRSKSTSLSKSGFSTNVGGTFYIDE